MRKNFAGAGLSLHLDQFDFVLKERPKLAYIEVIADNFLSPGPQHDKLEALAQDYNILLHCVNGNVGGIDPIDGSYWTAVKRLSDRYGCIHISDHLCFQAHDEVYFHDLLPFPLTDESLKRVACRVDQIQQLLGQTILLENLSYYIEFEDSNVSEAQFLNELFRSCGSGFLLDLNNIWVNEQNLGLSAQTFIEELDSEGIREIHLAGPEEFDGTYIDTHGSKVHKDTIEMLHNLEHWQGIPIIYERDRNIPVWPELLMELDDINRMIGAL